MQLSAWRLWFLQKLREQMLDVILLQFGRSDKVLRELEVAFFIIAHEPVSGHIQFLVLWQEKRVLSHVTVARGSFFAVLLIDEGGNTFMDGAVLGRQIVILFVILVVVAQLTVIRRTRSDSVLPDKSD